MTIKPDPQHAERIEPLPGNDDRIAVYRFELWDRALAKNVAAPKMATADTIRRLKGIADLNSKYMVAKTALDSDGFHTSDCG